MNLIASNIAWIMIVSGLLTASMVQAAISPKAALRSMFGESLEGPLAEIVVRNWGALIALIGAMLIYGAYDPSVRPLVLVIAGASKLVFIALVLGQGGRYLKSQVRIAVAIDIAMVALFALYLLIQ